MGCQVQCRPDRREAAEEATEERQEGEVRNVLQLSRVVTLFPRMPPRWAQNATRASMRVPIRAVDFRTRVYSFSFRVIPFSRGLSLSLPFNRGTELRPPE